MLGDKNNGGENSKSMLSDFEEVAGSQSPPPPVKEQNKASEVETPPPAPEKDKSQASKKTAVKKPAKKKPAAKKAPAKTKPKAKPKAPAKTKPKAKPKAPAKTKPEPKAKAKLKPKPKTKPKAKVKGGGKAVIRKSELLHVDPRKIIVEDGWNPRIDFGDLEELKASIKSEGVERPLQLRRNARNQFVIIDGERRLRAVMDLIGAGIKITSIPAIEVRKGISDTEAMMRTITANTGKLLTPIEEADAFRRLIAWGLTEEDLVQRTGKSMSTVKGRLVLIDAAPSVRNALDRNEISVGTAKRIVRASKGKNDKQDKLVKDTVTAKNKARAGKALDDDVAAASKQKLSGKRARELLFEVASARSKFERSRKPPSSMNRAYTALVRVETKLVKMKRKGLLRP